MTTLSDDSPVSCPTSAVPGLEATAVASPTAFRSRGLDRLDAWADREWLPFVAVLMLPALGSLVGGDWRRAGFFAGTAIYLGVLKWVGWLILSRTWCVTPRALLFPAELMAGLAVLAGWFYLRNALGFLWPASYSLRELALLPWLAAAVHLADSLRRLARGRPSRAALLADAWPRGFLYGGFTLALTLALALRSGSLTVQHADALFHAVNGRVLHDHGFLYRHPLLDTPLVYPSGLGALTAVGMAVSPLSHVQLVNLQYTALLVIAPFLITTAAALLAGRPLLGLHALAPAFLVFVPLYSLYPEAFGSSTGRQAAPPLLAAAVLLAVVAPRTPPRALAALVLVNALLLALAAAFNPACVPYTAAASLLVLGILAGQGLRTAPAGAWPRVAAVTAQAGTLTLVSALVLLCDPYYHRQARAILRPATAASAAKPDEPAKPNEPAPPSPAPRFSTAAARRWLAGVNPLQLSESFSTLRGTVWTPRWPHRAYIPLALALTAAAAVSYLRLRWRGLPPVRDAARLLALAAAALALGLLTKYAAHFLIGGLSGEYYETHLLWIYTGFLLIRCELLLTFTALTGAAAALVLLVPRAWGWPRRLRLLGPALGVALVGGAALAWYQGTPSGDLVAPLAPQFLIADDDLRLVAWANDHLPPDRGLIGLPAAAHRSHRFAQDAFTFPLGGATAFPLYSRHPNYCFAIHGDDRIGLDDYIAHVRDDFHPAWLAEHGLHYFFLTPDGLAGNPGLAQALRGGALRELHREGRAAIYQVVPPAPAP